MITPLMKINVLIQETKITHGVHHVRKSNLRTEASRDTRCSHALNMQLPRVIADRAIHYGLEMDGQSFGQNQ